MGYLLKLFWFLLTLQVTNAQGRRSCPGGFEKLGDNCYWFSSHRGVNQKATWSSAKKNCEDLGHTNPPKTVSLAEMGAPGNCGSDVSLMEAIADKKNVVWLGAEDARHNGNWLWVHSRRSLSLKYPFWGPIEPSNGGGNEWCLGTTTPGSYRPLRHYLNDLTCTDLYHFVCQLF